MNESQERTINAVEKVLQVVTAVLLAVVAYFLTDVYTRFQKLEERVHEHELESERRLTTLEARDE